MSFFSRRAFLNASLLLLGGDRASATPAGQAAPAGRLRGRAVINVKAFQIENAKDHARRTAAGIAAPGESADLLPFIPELSGPDQFRTLSKLLAARGHGSSRIDKILAGNVLRFARDVWGSSSRSA